MFNIEHKVWAGFEKQAYRNAGTQKLERPRFRGLEMLPVTRGGEKAPNCISTGAQLSSFLEQTMPERRGVHRHRRDYKQMNSRIETSRRAVNTNSTPDLDRRYA